MSLQGKAFRDGVAVAVIDPSAPYASGIRRVLPQARIVLDHARTEGYNRVIKQIRRVACGFHNQDNYERRILLHSAAHRAA